MPTAKKDYASFTVRAARSQYVLDRFGKVLKNNVLDVGCDEAPLRALLPNEKYYGVDICGKPDQVLNLEECKRLPFEDESFDCVMCIEVLEHLNNLHDMFQELFRVSSQNVIVSLPNCWCGARGKLDKGRGDILHYGLPHRKPIDRHKWFFNVSQVSDFFAAAHPADFQLAELRYAEKPRPLALRLMRRLYYTQSAYDNRYAHTVFARYERIASSQSKPKSSELRKTA
ncbi:MAG: class I SAM-dependent methyltransferase [Planctomycetaceae bacterium]|nr:class I SAM-dependent methyltransferase [Planctomycetaceae bacterium]